jgi:hypothetical protein
MGNGYVSAVNQNLEQVLVVVVRIVRGNPNELEMVLQA